MSVLETMAGPIRRKYHTRRILKEELAIEWAKECIYSLDKKTINRLIDNWGDRFRECARREGAMTRF